MVNGFSNLPDLSFLASYIPILFLGFFIFVYVVGIFFIIYHLLRFGIGIVPKILVITSLVSSLLVIFVIIHTYNDVRWLALGTEIRALLLKSTYQIR